MQDENSWGENIKLYGFDDEDETGGYKDNTLIFDGKNDYITIDGNLNVKNEIPNIKYFQIGKTRWNSITGFFNGKMYAVRIYNKCLNEKDIKENYNKTIACHNLNYWLLLGFIASNAKLSPKAVKNAAKSPISSVVKSCEIKIAKLLARPIKFEPDKLDKFIDSSPLDIILKNK